ncbi:MAG: hypothetical protein Q7U34_01385 [Anaerolineales bacterium]|nr:hypothetical protein [Anaerolineales bacterium]MDP3185119.1 hypothetical protein [Anaerolineales bacterium]
MLDGLIVVESVNTGELSDLTVWLNVSRQVHNPRPVDACDYLSDGQNRKPFPLCDMSYDLRQRATI